MDGGHTSLNVPFHVKHAEEHVPPSMEPSGFAEALGVQLSSDAVARLLRFEVLLGERAVPRGLIARSDAGRLRERHVLDCLRALVALEADDTTAYDIGSGAGLPGLVVAIARPDLQVRLVEPRRMRVAFLELALLELGIGNASVVATRIEDVSVPADICFARAFADLSGSWRAARPRLRPGGRLVYFGGADDRRPQPPIGVSEVHVQETPLLESSGPLIIMAR